MRNRFILDLLFCLIIICIQCAPDEKESKDEEKTYINPNWPFPKHLPDCAKWEQAAEGWFQIPDINDLLQAYFSNEETLWYTATAEVEGQKITLVSDIFHLHIYWQTSEPANPIQDGQAVQLYALGGFDWSNDYRLWLLDENGDTLLFDDTMDAWDPPFWIAEDHFILYDTSWECEYKSTKPPGEGWESAYGLGIFGSLDGIFFYTYPWDRIAESLDGNYLAYLLKAYRGQLVFGEEGPPTDCCPDGEFSLQVVKKR